jgi:hypothetical protein
MNAPPTYNYRGDIFITHKILSHHNDLTDFIICQWESLALRPLTECLILGPWDALMTN